MVTPKRSSILRFRSMPAATEDRDPPEPFPPSVPRTDSDPAGDRPTRPPHCNGGPNPQRLPIHAAVFCRRLAVNPIPRTRASVETATAPKPSSCNSASLALDTESDHPLGETGQLIWYINRSTQNVLDTGIWRNIMSCGKYFCIKISKTTPLLKFSDTSTGHLGTPVNSLVCHFFFAKLFPTLKRPDNLGPLLLVRPTAGTTNVREGTQWIVVHF